MTRKANRTRAAGLSLPYDRAIAFAVSMSLLAVAGCYRAAAVEALVPVGGEFPQWSMKDQEGRQWSSAELSGRRYLLWYYPKASTPG
jgi:hypothetical protein